MLLLLLFEFLKNYSCFTEQSCWKEEPFLGKKKIAGRNFSKVIQTFNLSDLHTIILKCNRETTN